VSLQVDTVFVWVTDLDSALTWYRTLGLAPGPRHGAWQVMEVDGETRFALHEGDRPNGPSSGVVAFRVEDLESEIERLAGHEIEPTADITDTGPSRFVTYQDPDGNEIQLLERRVMEAT